MMSKEQKVQMTNELQHLEAYYWNYYEGCTFELNNGKVTDFHENENK